MANLFKIKILAREKKISIRALANELGMTEQGLQLLIRENSTKIDTLERIASILDVPVGVFFDEENKNRNINSHNRISGGKNIVGNGNKMTDDNLQYLQKQIAKKDELIDKLSNRIIELTNKLVKI